MRILFLSILAFITISTNAQTPEAILDSLNAGRKPEKIFTHFDKEFYQPGETIWFKTYFTVDGRPGAVSSVAKAELVHESGTVVASQLMPVSVGSATGSLVLPATLGYGTYVFRLYTQQMIRSQVTEPYIKSIPVVSSAADLARPEMISDISLRFMPEGGVFLAGEVNILAFIATDQLGWPAETKGVIKDSQGNEVATFATELNGMGRLEITPKKGERYTASYNLPSGASRSIVLPDVREEGTNLLIVDEVAKKRIICNSQYATNASQKPAYIIGEMDQTLIFKIDISKSNGHFMGKVPVKDLPGGLLHVAVFNEANSVLAERTCFVNSQKEIVNASLKTVNTSLDKRGANTFEFSLPDSLEGMFSVSVTDIDQTRLPIKPANLIAATLVTSSLEPSASFPFYDLGPLAGGDRNEAVDLLLLTKKYKWNWATLTKMAASKATPGDDFITLEGKAFADRNNRPPLPMADLAFIVVTKDSAVNSFTTRTDANGFFSVSGLFFEDTAKIHVRNNSEKNRDKKVQLELTSTPVADHYRLPINATELFAMQPGYFRRINDNVKTKQVAKHQPFLDLDSNVIVLEELVVKSKTDATKALEQKYTSGLFAGTARATIDFINDRPGYTAGNIFDYMKGRYSYIQVVGNYPNYALIYRGMRSLGSGTPIFMSLYLDEMIVDATTLSTIPLRDIALVRIFTSGITGTGGALAVYTKKGDGGLSSNGIYDNTYGFSLPGFSKPSSFYSPDYGNKKLNVKRDDRNTLYWNPSLIFLPEDGMVDLSFYNNDNCKQYKIVVQGFTTDGKMVYLEQTIP